MSKTCYNNNRKGSLDRLKELTFSAGQDSFARFEHDFLKLQLITSLGANTETLINMVFDHER